MKFILPTAIVALAIFLSGSDAGFVEIVDQYIPWVAQGEYKLPTNTQELAEQIRRLNLHDERRAWYDDHSPSSDWLGSKEARRVVPGFGELSSVDHFYQNLNLPSRNPDHRKAVEDQMKAEYWLKTALRRNTGVEEARATVINLRNARRRLLSRQDRDTLEARSPMLWFALKSTEAAKERVEALRANKGKLFFTQYSAVVSQMHVLFNRAKMIIDQSDTKELGPGLEDLVRERDRDLAYVTRQLNVISGEANGLWPNSGFTRYRTRNPDAASSSHQDDPPGGFADFMREQHSELPL